MVDSQNVFIQRKKIIFILREQCTFDSYTGTKPALEGGKNISENRLCPSSSVGRAYGS